MDDVRDVLEFYRQFDDPIEAFRENQRKLQEEMEKGRARKRLADLQLRSLKERAPKCNNKANALLFVRQRWA